ncbi:hypothetical protein EKD16_09770 [Streptomonospora litoralis]|uniref:Uncharacterized protein n=1 Tax=Streptomonospora litoralis TaxID=2498135 RepID=A0A4V0ZJJ9_9ACTN|nr:hypothetical protein EKD16_09770 [Streptomonospora litoralis]
MSIRPVAGRAAPPATGSCRRGDPAWSAGSAEHGTGYAVDGTRQAQTMERSFSMSLTGSSPTGVTLRWVTPAARKAATRSRT